MKYNSEFSAVSVSSAAKIDASSLDHGFFQFTFPKGWKKITTWIIASVVYFAAFIFFVISLGIPDVPPVEEITTISTIEDISDVEESKLGNGWGEYKTGKFFIIEATIVEGELIHGYWEYDSDGENCTSYVDYTDWNIVISPIASSETANISWFGSLGEEANHKDRDCESRYYDWYVTEGDKIEIFGVEIEDELYFMSVGAEGFSAPERTNREDSQRFALFLCIIASLMMMITTPTSLSFDIQKLRTRWGNLPFAHGKPGEIEEARGPIRVLDDNDWILPQVNFEDWSDDAYTEDEGGKLIEEHPNKIGTPVPATLTLYSVNGVLFVIFSLWLSSDLLARHNDGLTELIGQILRVAVVIFTLVWLIFAYKKWKLSHSILDTPTSNVRSVAVGPAELVGQVRPAPSGTLSVKVADDADKIVEGVVLYKWVEEEYVCTKDSDGKESCSWVTRDKGKGHTLFMLHDGTGGILVDPSTWRKPIFGDPLQVWQWSNMRWTVHALCAGDPVYCLGRVEPRRGDYAPEEGCPTEIQNANLVVTGESDVGTYSKFARGTELSVVSNLRSTTESIIIPVLMIIFSAIPFIW